MKKQQRMKEVRRKRRIMFTVLAVCIFLPDRSFRRNKAKTGL